MQLIHTRRIAPTAGVLFAFFFALAIAKPVQLTALAQSPAPVERGKFILHKMEQPIGEETYQITRDGDSLNVKIDFKFTDRSSPVPLTASFRSTTDLAPVAFEIKGKNSRETDIDEAVEVQSEKIRLRDRDKWTEAARPPQFFTIAGYAPTTMQMLMVRYWANAWLSGAARHSSQRSGDKSSRAARTPSALLAKTRSSIASPSKD